MLAFLGRRLGSLVLTLFVSSVLIFGSMYLVPGDPAIFLSGSSKTTPEQLDVLRSQYNLDDPLLQRYVEWLGGVLHGDFGQSLQYKVAVQDLIASRLPTTVTLIVLAGILILVGGFVLGLIAALKRGIVDKIILLGISAAVATPVFVVGVLLLAVFSVGLGWFPATGSGEGFADRLWHLTLPAIALALSLIGAVARIARSSFVENLNREHVTVARGRGRSEERRVGKECLL